MATEQPAKATSEDVTINVVDSLYDLIREIFASYARQISQTAKIGDQFKMIQQCRELTPQDVSQKAVWQFIEQARQDLLNAASDQTADRSNDNPDDADADS